jgi:hypothetical protein
MKTILLSMGSLVLAVGILVTFPCDSRLFAQSGCCKRRDSLRVPWARVQMPFEQCKQLNDQTDRDNVFDQRGLVWWDSSCS